jgi:hypothetical protein
MIRTLNADSDIREAAGFQGVDGSSTYCPKADDGGFSLVSVMAIGALLMECM